MSAAAPLTFPGGRVVAGWWRQLAPHRPHNLWIAYLVVHRVEVLVRTGLPGMHDPLLSSVLALLKGTPLSLSDLDARLCLGPQLTRQALRILEAGGLAYRRADGSFTLTAPGQPRPSRRAPSLITQERRQLYFLKSSAARPAPTYVALPPLPRPRWPAGADWDFDLSQLETCVRQNAEWRRRSGFPADILEVVAPGHSPQEADLPNEPPEWQRIAIVHAERLPVALVQFSGKGGEKCLGFEFQQQGWHLQATAPALTLGDDWRELLPELTSPVPVSEWRLSWQTWLQSRGILDADVASCRLERSASQLQIRASPRLVERFRSVIRPAVQGDIWLLAGEGRFREALHVDLAPATSTS